MTFRLRQIDTAASGREIVRETLLDRSSLTIGRAAENEIHLPDLAVEPHQARIALRDDGRIVVQAIGTLGFTLNGAKTTSATVDSRTGAELGFGTYRIAISAEPDGAVALTVRVRTSAGGPWDEADKHKFSLAAVLPGKRRTGWTLAALILVAFLAVPVFSHLTRPAEAQHSVIGDRSWSTGQLNLAHHGLEDSCESCHVKAFEPVSDDTCLGCHKAIHDHADAPQLDVARASGGLGDRALWAVAHRFGKPGPGACSDCHTEHEGLHVPIKPAGQKFCASCHATMDRRLPATSLGNAADFGTAHPQFTARISTGAGSVKTVRVSLDDNPKERSGLSFSHRLHLDPLGGAARMAGNIGAERGYEGVLRCKDCHRPTEDKARFRPIEMERDCEGCHSLVYDRVGPTFRSLTHGNVAQMIAGLRATDRSPSRITGLGLTRPRPGRYSGTGRYHANFAVPVSGEVLLRRALSPGGVCGECHTPDFRNGNWTVKPVALTERYMTTGWFDHAPHLRETCTSCHKAGQSSKASDLLMPKIAQCRTCHMGEDNHKADVPSTCAMCHSYHPGDMAPFSRRPAPLQKSASLQKIE
ncbi:cytochrome C [Croceicoccus ponticola]|uniref:Cytochrome C n=1 Tax=Croceicoccus ponticola TaxID=2217664 RepID=A0A437GWB2_9SPHN|nr:cytochrome c3 family protein [Croceicoccus ponticola]RVQ66382.1 cytochrome C [Croceicoccus ponticola]